MLKIFKAYDFSYNFFVFSRSFIMSYDSDERYEGVPVYRFAMPSSVLANASKNPNNEGFCTPDLNHCHDDGVLNLSSCSGKVT